MLPSVKCHVEKRQKATLGRTSDRKERSFDVGDIVQVRQFNAEKWISGVVKEVLGHRHYMVETVNGLVKRHIDQIIKRELQVIPEEQEIELTDDDVIQDTEDFEVAHESSGVTEPVISESVKGNTSCVKIETPVKVTNMPERRYPDRERKLPSHLSSYILK